MKALSIGLVNVRRMIRERSNIFFVFIFPIALVLLIGVQFGSGFAPVIGVHQSDDGRLSDAIVSSLQDDESIDVRMFSTTNQLTTGVEEGSIQAGVLLPEGMDDTAASGEPIAIGFMARTDGTGGQLQSIVGAALSEIMSPVGAAQFASAETGASFPETLEVTTGLSEQFSGIQVDVSSTGEATFPDTLGQFDLGASSQLVLFVFLTALAGSSALILTRQLGISKRMLSTPTPIGTIVVGESLGRFSTAFVQGIYIMVLTFAIFSVNWGDLLGAVLILITFAAVGAGAGMLLGAVFSNDQQAGGVGVMIALGLAALGGAMFPLDLFSPTMQKVAHLTPHAWALDGFAELVRRGGTVVDILPELGVLTLYAVVLLALASWRLRVAITRP
ncbi:MAG TPA: ABC transporter permease [Acidimicrobiia bacterium]|nr:ABC transporter permease [Acidimicrobiia bacterium]